MVPYAQTITHPELRLVLGPGTEQLDVLELGPLHLSSNYIRHLHWPLIHDIMRLDLM
ncbi:hypothetical protein EST38_g11067 [Candolleomyces aberdarensis]|uniref:Uncharacterized protein n=1 Tax=Candolleomyces aberdarensis TaxID=2316362 RepID=A0A4Q2D5S3_9AGAR|nr:hypothetical protein EST38_g11067 [Candolleomyces aberdarensis]